MQQLKLEDFAYVDAEEGEVPQAAARPHARQGVARVELSFGDYGLKVMERGWITDRQIEASRVAMTRFIKRGGKIWLRLFPDKPITKKPAETRMGKGKGAPDHWVAVVRPGKILFEMEGVSRTEMRRRRCGWRRTSCRLQTKFVQRHEAH